MSTICLNMIVKNEAAVIRRCLESVADHIQSWVISDTGSTDGTQGIIREFFAARGIPGELIEHEWVDFGTNRNLALQSLECDHGFITGYILFMDADDQLVVADGCQLLPPLATDGFMIPIEYSGLRYALPKLVRADLPWEWKGAVHEYLTMATPHSFVSHPSGCHIAAATEGARSQNPNKYLSDALLLEAEIRREPDNTRAQFYLAQSYRDAGILELARVNYLKRIQMQGWDEENYVARLEYARCLDGLDFPADTVSAAYLEAFNYRPSRAESLHGLAYFWVKKGQIALAALYAAYLKEIPLPADILFVESGIYTK